MVWGSVSDSPLTAQIIEVEWENEALKTRVAMANGLVIELQEWNVVLLTRLDGLSTDLEMSKTDFGRRNGELTTVRDEMKSARAEVSRDVNIQEVE